MVALRWIMGVLMVAGTATAQLPEMETSVDDQSEVAITVYNNGQALVRDVRRITMPDGDLALRFADVAQQIRPETVGLRSLSAPGSVAILEQNYEYDLISPDKLMEKYVGKRVILRNYHKDIGFESIEAELISVNNGPVYRVDGQIFLGHPGQVVLPEIPENLIAKPSLIWQLRNEGAEQELEVTYLTNGVSWKADYVLTLDRNDEQMDLSGWVTMDNRSGATYHDAQIKLVAGDVNIVREAMMGMGGGMMDQAMMARASAEMMPQQEAFAEFHLYTMPRRSTVAQNQTKQLALLSASNIACEKVYEFRGQPQFFYQRIPQFPDQRVTVFVEFENEEANNLGMPLPGGIMRIYQEDSQGMLLFAGEDRIQHTPRNEKVRLRMGNAFDVVGERTQMDYRIIATNVHESAYEISIRNRKETAETVEVIEPMPGDWEILESSHDYEKRDARTAVFSIDVPADTEVKVTYRVRVRQ